MDRAGADEVVALVVGVVFQHRVQVRHVLEVVGVDVAAGQGGVRQDVVLEALDLQVDAFLRQYRLGLFEDLGVRHVGGADHQLARRGGAVRGEGGDGGESQHQ